MYIVDDASDNIYIPAQIHSIYEDIFPRSLGGSPDKHLPLCGPFRVLHDRRVFLQLRGDLVEVGGLQGRGCGLSPVGQERADPADGGA